MKELTADDRAKLDLTFGYHVPSKNAVKYSHEYWRDHCRELAATAIQLLGSSREASLVMTKIEEAMFWGNAAIARQQIPLYGNEDPRAEHPTLYEKTSTIVPPPTDTEATGIERLLPETTELSFPDAWKHPAPRLQSDSDDKSPGEARR